jgi:hypothetical protein
MSLISFVIALQFITNLTLLASQSHPVVPLSLSLLVAQQEQGNTVLESSYSPVQFQIENPNIAKNDRD